ncbi:MAG: NADH-quinone oxidoreductase subunit NuoG [Gammaproteobacteria bacterium]|nr:MAG: NADH-quinone oxidoreductase subunit NuoG [Gammaproteobacteria bacterium]
MSAKPETGPEMVTIEIDGQSIEAPVGSMLIQAADAAGITIPRFCYHKKLSIAASCRMCLVDIEKAPKPMPACATPVTDGMKVHTQSAATKLAQKSVMEFLLINHPLDCPICDQGGECRLQDQAVGYGSDVSRYSEAKRIVKDKNLGPLISTDMTRCIHCTRCVRFGQEVAGVMELGATGRGEHMSIGTLIEKSIDSELSGNVIDLCPVGALTSKPFRYSARPWELSKHDGISPHDSVASSLTVHTRGGRVMRVVPKENEAVNETWISDRDRFSYEGLYVEDRLQTPLIKINGDWQETDWNGALQFAARGLRKVIDKHGAGQVGALAAPGSTLEEFYLLQKLMRAAGSNNVDHRVRQIDFTDDHAMPLYPGLGQRLSHLQSLNTVLLIGSNVRKDQPLLGLRLRKMQQAGGQLMVINPVDYVFTHALANKTIASPQGMLQALAGVVKALVKTKRASLAKEVKTLLSSIVAPSSTDSAMAKALLTASKASVLLGDYSFAHPQSAQLRLLAQITADLSGASLGFLPAANSAAAWVAGCLPHRTAKDGAVAQAGRDAFAMIKEPLKAYITMGLEPDLDCLDGGRTHTAMALSEFVIMMTAYKPRLGQDHADVLLPMSAFTETAGTMVNCEGRPQVFQGAVAPYGDARPAWKILRVLGNMMELEGFDYDSIEDVRNELALDALPVEIKLKEMVHPPQLGAKALDLVRITETPIYAVDALVRRAVSLQATADNPGAAARINEKQATTLGVTEGDKVRLRMLEGDAEVQVVIDERVPDGCVLSHAGFVETAALGASGQVTVTKV